jgi:hypothetical protein
LFTSFSCSDVASLRNWEGGNYGFLSQHTCVMCFLSS